MKTSQYVALLSCFLATASSFAPKTTSTSVGVSVSVKDRLRTQILAAGLDEGHAVMDRKVSINTTGDYLQSISNTATKESTALQEVEKEQNEAQNLMQKIKDAGTAGIISYALWEMGFWILSVPVVVFGYASVMGHLPDLSSQEDTAKLGAEAFAFVNLARFAVPLRIGLALGTTPWIEENVVQRFFNKDEEQKEQDIESFESYDPATKMQE